MTKRNEVDPPETEEEDEHTLVVDRSEPAEEDEEHTLVVDRSESAEVSENDDEDEHTLVVDRSAFENDDEDEHTLVVDRSEVDESTLVVDRSEPDESTLVVDRSDEAERTIAVDRQPVKRDNVMRTLPRRGGKRQITLAPGANANKKATLAAGPGAVAEYPARTIPAPPPSAAVVELGPEATRANAPSMPSVAKLSRRGGLIALVSAAAAVVISIVGLVLIVGAFING